MTPFYQPNTYVLKNNIPSNSFPSRQMIQAALTSLVISKALLENYKLNIIFLYYPFSCVDIDATVLKQPIEIYKIIYSLRLALNSCSRRIYRLINLILRLRVE